MWKLIKTAMSVSALSFISIANAEENYSFSIDSFNYQMLEQSLSTKQGKSPVIIVALWEISSPRYSGRWYVEVQGCDKPIGTITIVANDARVSHSWSWDGTRAYDLMSGMHCAMYAIKGKK